MKTIAETLYDAQQNAYEVPQVTETHGAFDIPKAYELQAELIDKYLERGSKIVGYKMGLTSREKMEQMGVEAPVHGVLLDWMDISAGDEVRALDGELHANGRVHFGELIHQKAEPEIAVRFSKDVPIGADESEIAASIGEVAPAIEIIDSRYLNFKFTMADVVADNCSSAQYAIGEWIKFTQGEIDLDKIHAAISVNGEVMSEGVSDAVLGSPLTALLELRRSLAEEGTILKAGQVVLTGAITAAFRFEQGDVVVSETDIGNVTIR